jgi:uncharacterized protein (DUF362 family)
MDRRRFISGAIGVGIGFAAGRLLPIAARGAAGGNISRVIAVRDSLALIGAELDHDRVVAMLDRAVTSLTGISDPSEAWRNIIAPDNPGRLKTAKVAIKVNALAGKRMSTHPTLAMAVARKIIDAGVRDGNVMVWDRSDRELTSAGYFIDQSGPIKVLGNEHMGFSDRLYSHRSIGSRFTKILTDWATDLINMPILKDHGIVGVSGGMKNLYATVHNPFKYHPNVGDPYVADLSDVSLIRDKLRLVIVDAFQAQYHGGPPYQKRWTWDENAIFVSTDPVAVDRIGWSVIEKKRQENGLPTLAEEKREPVYIFSAEKLGLGVADLDRMELIDA